MVEFFDLGNYINNVPKKRKEIFIKIIFYALQRSLLLLKDPQMQLIHF
jgi:hypothetical protein